MSRMSRDSLQDTLAHFNTLSPLDRRTLYHHLLDQLQLHEWRDVRDRLHQVSFHRDILASLPPELAVQIVQYLDLAELHLLRRVSRSWGSLLSSQLACDVVFNKYTGPQGPSPQTRKQYARQRLRLERGHPVWGIQPSINTHRPIPPTPNMAQMDYAKGRYAWIHNNHATLVHDLRARTTRVFCTENRDIFSHVRVSDSILAAITPRGYCMVWNLLTYDEDDPVSFRIPSVNCSAFVVSGVHVAIAIDGRDRSVIHWDLHSRVAHTISVARPIVFMALNPAFNILVTAHIEEIPSSHLRIVNHPLPSKNQPHPLSYTVPLPGVSPVSAQTTPFLRTPSTAGYFHVTPAPGQEPSCVMATAYDERTDRVSVHILTSEDTLFEDRCVAAPVDHNLLYYLKNDRGKPRVWISNADALPAARHRPARSIDPQLPREATSRVYSSSGSFALMGDRDFVLMVDENGLKVWCFDELVEY